MHYDRRMDGWMDRIGSAQTSVTPLVLLHYQNLVHFNLYVAEAAHYNLGAPIFF